MNRPDLHQRIHELLRVEPAILPPHWKVALEVFADVGVSLVSSTSQIATNLAQVHTDLVGIKEALKK